jgi:hypothetical protein
VLGGRESLDICTRRLQFGTMGRRDILLISIWMGNKGKGRMWGNGVYDSRIHIPVQNDKGESLED